MIDDSVQNLMGEQKTTKKDDKPKIASIAKFRAAKDNDEE